MGASRSAPDPKFEENLKERNFSMELIFVDDGSGDDSLKKILAFKKNRNDIISEIEFGFSQTDSKIIGVTGSNGKTTTATMIYHILKKSGFNVALAGNIGKSFSGSILW